MAEAVAMTLVSCPPDHAEHIARMLIDARLAACVNVLPKVKSIYRWNDAIENVDESLLLIKHPADSFDVLRAALLAAHPYELPEIITVNLDKVHPPYLTWILASCS